MKIQTQTSATLAHVTRMIEDTPIATGEHGLHTGLSAATPVTGAAS